MREDTKPTYDRKPIDLFKAVTEQSLDGQSWTLTGLRQDQPLCCRPDAVCRLARWTEEFGINVENRRATCMTQHLEPGERPRRKCVLMAESLMIQPMAESLIDPTGLPATLLDSP